MSLLGLREGVSTLSRADRQSTDFDIAALIFCEGWYVELGFTFERKHWCIRGNGAD